MGFVETYSRGVSRVILRTTNDVWFEATRLVRCIGPSEGIKWISATRDRIEEQRDEEARKVGEEFAGKRLEIADTGRSRVSLVALTYWRPRVWSKLLAVSLRPCSIRFGLILQKPRQTRLSVCPLPGRTQPLQETSSS